MHRDGIASGVFVRHVEIIRPAASVVYGGQGVALCHLPTAGLHLRRAVNVYGHVVADANRTLPVQRRIAADNVLASGNAGFQLDHCGRAHCPGVHVAAEHFPNVLNVLQIARIGQHHEAGVVRRLRLRLERRIVQEARRAGGAGKKALLDVGQRNAVRPDLEHTYEAVRLLGCHG